LTRLLQESGRQSSFTTQLGDIRGTQIRDTGKNGAPSRRSALSAAVLAADAVPRPAGEIWNLIWRDLQYDRFRELRDTPLR
jgi:hypothetical protein